MKFVCLNVPSAGTAKDICVGAATGAPIYIDLMLFFGLWANLLQYALKCSGSICVVQNLPLVDIQLKESRAECTWFNLGFQRIDLTSNMYSFGPFPFKNIGNYAI